MAKTNKNTDNEEPNTAPQPDKWYNLSLGPSFKDRNNSSPKFYTFRYEFKPASIDKNQPGSLHKSKDNKVSVEYNNNQHGKPKVSFEGVSEDYKETDAVLFFDGENFRLERLHHAVKRLRHVRLPGDSAPPAVVTVAPYSASPVETQLPGVGKGVNQQSFTKGIDQEMPVQVEKIGIVDSQNIGVEVKDGNSPVYSRYSINPAFSQLEPKDVDFEGHAHMVIDDDNTHGVDDKENASGKGFRSGLDIDINVPHHAGIDEEIADVDISNVEGDKGPNAAEALRAQVNAEGRKQQVSTTSSSSESESSESGSRSGSESGSGSGSSSSDSESSEGDSITSI